MKFNDPQIFWWMIPAVMVTVVLAVRAAKSRRRQLKLLLGSGADDPDAVRLSRGIRIFRLILLMLTVMLLLCAAARPYWTSRMIPYSRQGRDVLVLFDVSKSMLAADIAPSRLEHAKFILRELIKNDPQDRFGLIAFAGTAYTVCPLTSDPVAFEQYIDELTPDLVPVGGTNLEKALAAAARAFKAAGGSNRAIILFTDGDELEGESNRIFAELKKRNTPLFIAGLGDPQAGAPVPDGMGGFRRDDSGKLIVTRLAEQKLISAAEATGGIYIRSTVTDTGLEELEKRIKALDPAERESGIRTVPVEKFPLALIAAAVVLVLYLVISERPRVKNMLMLLLPLLLVCGAAENPQTVKTQVPVVQTPEKLPESPEELYNLARKKQLEGDTEAVKLYEKVLKRSEKHPELQARSLFNIGTGVHRGGQESITGALVQVQSQQLDPALKKLDEAEKRLKEAQELYSGALAFREADGLISQSSGNLQLLEADFKKIKDLKKKIEDLKKQHQQAKNDVKKAKDQNKQDQNKQDQNKQDQNKQDQNKQDQNKQDQNKQDQNKQDQQQKDDAIDQAGKSVQDLKQKADELKQNDLGRQAQQAQQELEKAKQEKDPEKREKHLDNAYKALGGDDKKDSDQKDKSDKNDGKNKENDQKKLPAQPRPEKKEQQKQDDKTSEQLLKMLNDEENKRREELIKMRQMRRVPVKKDW